MTDGLEDLLRRVKRLEDEREIRELLSRYAFAADLGYAASYVDLYAEGGRVNLGAGRFGAPRDGRTAYVGHEEIWEFITDTPHVEQQGNCQHHALTGPLILHIDGDDAIAEGYSLVIVKSDEDSRRTRSARPVKPSINISGANFNHWTLRRVDGSWKIQERLNREVGDPLAYQVVGTTMHGAEPDDVSVNPFGSSSPQG
ncbi:nuclear transport factor 2 family protein [Rhodococcus sp. BP-349]|uniref:nuclear transport factor 2 family protein n=1 Tax=unclassified Rhodococcus (in: high G+C Gram-positive bacteria) TaxID=192944 RepID=UPI001C9B85E1|nr:MULTISPECIES: nuclear transport factor 2 family protein [unclassified Rhodococcus (in: high G+C Gram-positive bacteria)]MBY6537765.1 nuclear transport factor 2 family protein [Rhodococcus sp. BP-363]MBY6542102.1 nuclear transport factor 2 family protein [Rhodococcus sp. BP-369]MBY6561332.1 nuclear transport factor 2 family protein [Rhodococcus sp. BP-370]MBY6575624.1 nuclear transport factor 2 family protein [Rhodococcus sp. BP-364]MBY6584925.1 nuclear transport factor 2 family protein [Rho